MVQGKVNGQEKLISHASPRSPVAEAYRHLYTAIQFSNPDRPLRTLLVTSTNPDEGKSTTLSNLAITMAQANKSVVLVDCDLHRPSLHELFGLRNTQGLTSLILEGALESFPFQESGVANLRLLTSGPLPPNPAALLGSNRMGEIIEQLRVQADYVLFDSPPIIAVTDAAVLASKVDGALLVIMAGRTKRDLAQKAKALLERVNANLIGVVLNNVRYDTSLHRYYAGKE